MSKEYQINIRVSEKEKNDLEERSKEKGMKRSEYIRERLFSDATESIAIDSKMYTNQIDYLKGLIVELQDEKSKLYQQKDNILKLLENELEKTKVLESDFQNEKRNYLELKAELEYESKKSFFKRLFSKR